VRDHLTRDLAAVMPLTSQELDGASLCLAPGFARPSRCLATYRSHAPTKVPKRNTSILECRTRAPPTGESRRSLTRSKGAIATTRAKLKKHHDDQAQQPEAPSATARCAS
jgi:hypothetical protein